MLITIAVILILWTGLTIWVESRGPARHWTYGTDGSERKALVVYDPDPIYNLDEKLCRAFAEELSAKGWFVQVKTTAAVTDGEQAYSLYVLCANTYNWAPDWAMQKFIKRCDALSGKQVVAITIGSGSTARSKRVFEKLILHKKGLLAGSRTFWLLRPNDENRMKEKNVKVAVDMVKQWAGEVTKKL